MIWKETIKLFSIITGLLLASQHVQAQHYTRFSISSSVASNQMWSSMSPGSGASWTNQLSFTPHYLFIMELENEKGDMNGKNRVIGDNSTSVMPFYTAYNYWGGNAGINLQKLFSSKAKDFRVITYLYAGVGFLDFNAERYAANSNQVTKRYAYNTYTSKVGLRFRFKINTQFDWLAAVETTMPRSFYVDANPVPKGYDKFTSLKLGLSYKIAATSKREYIDWQVVNRGRRACAGRFY